MNLLPNTMGLSEMAHRVSVILRGSKQRIEKEQSAVRKRASETVFRPYDPDAQMLAEQEADYDTGGYGDDMTCDLLTSLANASEFPQAKPPLFTIDGISKEEDFSLTPVITADTMDGDSQTIDTDAFHENGAPSATLLMASRHERLKIHHPDTAENLDYLLQDSRNADAVFRDEVFLDELFPKNDDEMEKIINRILATKINTQDTAAAA